VDFITPASTAPPQCQASMTNTRPIPMTSLDTRFGLSLAVVDDGSQNSSGPLQVAPDDEHNSLIHTPLARGNIDNGSGNNDTNVGNGDSGSANGVDIGNGSSGTIVIGNSSPDGGGGGSSGQSGPPSPSPSQGSPSSPSAISPNQVNPTTGCNSSPTQNGSSLASTPVSTPVDSNAGSRMFTQSGSPSVQRSDFLPSPSQNDPPQK
jgi:hypothetical protein